MPNWCTNELIIEGKPKDLSKLMKQVEITASEETDEHNKSLFSCHRIIPRPAIADKDWYEWNIANWGSKWDTNDPCLNNSDWEEGIIRYSFSTAWSPINSVIEALAKQNPKVTITYNYWEGGSDFWGELELKKGEVTSFDEGCLSDAGCERLEYLMGDHHNCSECWNEMECQGEATPQICEECDKEQSEADLELWEGEAHGRERSILTVVSSV
jgi:hypothetical protein